jgi:ribonuclease I
MGKTWYIINSLNLKLFSSLSGTCAFRTGEEYLSTIEKVFSQLTIPDLKTTLRDTRIDQYKIKKVFLEKNPRLRANQIIVYMKDKELVDIKICYDLKLNFTNCYL